MDVDKYMVQLEEENLKLVGELTEAEDTNDDLVEKNENLISLQNDLYKELKEYKEKYAEVLKHGQSPYSEVETEDEEDDTSDLWKDAPDVSYAFNRGEPEKYSIDDAIGDVAKSYKVKMTIGDEKMEVHLNSNQIEWEFNEYAKELTGDKNE